MAVMIPDPAHPAYVRSLNVGKRESTSATRSGVTGIAKRPVEAAQVRPPGPRRGGLGSGLVGDFIGSAQHHGGDYQAVYAVAREELDWWQSELGRDLPDGMFGENLTTVGVEVDKAFVGERWQVGEVLLEVTVPRIPCRTFASIMGEEKWVKRFTAHLRSGAYLSIVTGGVVRQGDPVEVTSRPDHGVTVARSFAAFSGDLEAMRETVDARCLNPVDHAQLERALARRTG